MKAKIKATGEIVHVGDYNTISHDQMYKDERPGPWRLEELDFNDTADYWTRLEHQYAGMAMQGLVTRGEVLGATKQEIAIEIADISDIIAHALVKKMKEERK